MWVLVRLMIWNFYDPTSFPQEWSFSSKLSQFPSNLTINMTFDRLDIARNWNPCFILIIWYYLRGIVTFCSWNMNNRSFPRFNFAFCLLVFNFLMIRKCLGSLSLKIHMNCLVLLVERIFAHEILSEHHFEFE